MDNHEHVEQRLSALERWRTTIEVSLGKHEVDKEYINKRFDALETELKGIKATANQVFWLILSTVIVYFLAFAFKGGLNI